MSRSYPRLDIVKFGQQLLATGDLDPIYLALDGLPQDVLHRWLIAYWCFYHAGFASYAAERKGAEFWDTLALAAENTTESPIGGRWPRGSERRHARGQQGIKMVRDLQQRYGDNPEAMIEYLIGGAPSYVDVAARAQEHTLFGPWISFKIADMLERVLGVHVDFTEAEVFMFKDPVKSALMVWRQYLGLPDAATPLFQAAAIQGVVNHLKEKFAGQKAPPLFDRPLGLQEIETILCKWKSHMNGHYPFMNDITEIHEGLTPWVKTSTLAAMMSARFATLKKKGQQYA